MSTAISLALAWAINAAALWVANALFSGVRIHGWWAYIIGAAVLGIANAVIKPLVSLITLPLIILTLGLFLLVINVAMIALAEWAAPHFSIDGFWTYVGTVCDHLAGQLVRAFGRRRARAFAPPALARLVVVWR